MMHRARGAWLVLIVLFAAACGGGSNPLQLAVGDCFDDPEVVNGRIHEITTTACDDPHDNEVYAVIDLADGEFPGVGDLNAIADESCLGAFDAYVGEPYLESDYFASYLAPSEGSWEDGDRTIACFLFDQRGPKVGSVRTNVG